jgi:hypothetical protein
MQCFNCGTKGYWTVKASGRVPLTKETKLLSIRSFCSEECRDEKEESFLTKVRNEPKKQDSFFVKLLLPILTFKIHPIFLIALLIGCGYFIYTLYV